MTVCTNLPPALKARNSLAKFAYDLSKEKNVSTKISVVGTTGSTSQERKGHSNLESAPRLIFRYCGFHFILFQQGPKALALSLPSLCAEMWAGRWWWTSPCSKRKGESQPRIFIHDHEGLDGYESHDFERSKERSDRECGQSVFPFMGRLLRDHRSGREEKVIVEKVIVENPMTCFSWCIWGF